MDFAGITVIATGLIGFGLVSKRLEGTIITVPLVFVMFGWTLGSSGIGTTLLNPGHGGIHAIAELTLILVLFSDAARIDVTRLVSDHTLPARMLLIGLPLTIVAGALAAKALFPETIWPAAFLLAAVLAPTDAALGQSVVSSPVVPVRIRQALNVESGLNDGIALPVVLICAIWAGAPTDDARGATDLALFAALQVTLGPIAGIVVGFAGARLVDAASDRQWMSEPFQGMIILALAILAFAAAELIGGNGFIAAFVGGMVFGGNLRHPCHFLFEFMETEGQLLTLLTFLIFGAAMLPEALHALSWPVVLYAVLSLSLVRLIPIALSLSSTGLSWPSRLFLGWFGPRGLASILFALLIVEAYPVAAGEAILACVILTVALSTLLHGVSAAPLAQVYGAFVAKAGECVETRPVSEMPIRHGTSLDRLFARKLMIETAENPNGRTYDE